MIKWLRRVANGQEKYLLHKQWIAMMTNNCNFQSSVKKNLPNGFARLNSFKNLKSYDYYFLRSSFWFFSTIASIRIIISWCVFVCFYAFCFLYTQHKLIISICSSMFITSFWLGWGKQGKQLVHTSMLA